MVRLHIFSHYYTNINFQTIYFKETLGTSEHGGSHKSEGRQSGDRKTRTPSSSCHHHQTQVS